MSNVQSRVKRTLALCVIGWVVVAGFVAASLATSQIAKVAGRYAGRTTLTERGRSETASVLLSQLTALARSRRVWRSVSSVLRDLNMHSNPKEILDHLDIARVKNSNLIAIDVILRDPTEAKIAADVVAVEIKKEYEADPSHKGSALVTVDPAVVFPAKVLVMRKLAADMTVVPVLWTAPLFMVVCTVALMRVLLTGRRFDNNP